MYLERSWRRWRSQRWCQIAAKGRPSWTRKLSQPEMRFLENVWYVWLFDSSRWYHLGQLVSGDVFQNLVVCPCLYYMSSTAKTTQTAGKWLVFSTFPLLLLTWLLGSFLFALFHCLIKTLSPIHHMQPLPLSCAVVERTKLLLPLTL